MHRNPPPAWRHCHGVTSRRWTSMTRNARADESRTRGDRGATWSECPNASCRAGSVAGNPCGTQCATSRVARSAWWAANQRAAPPRNRLRKDRMNPLHPSSRRAFGRANPLRCVGRLFRRSLSRLVLVRSVGDLLPLRDRCGTVGPREDSHPHVREGRELPRIGVRSPRSKSAWGEAGPEPRSSLGGMRSKGLGREGGRDDRIVGARRGGGGAGSIVRLRDGLRRDRSPPPAVREPPPPFKARLGRSSMWKATPVSSSSSRAGQRRNLPACSAMAARSVSSVTSSQPHSPPHAPSGTSQSKV
eukprot:scaffold76250_cov27-Tisochrysis_lutea.AAC.3